MALRLNDIINSCFSYMNPKYIRIHTESTPTPMKAASNRDTGIICTFDLKYEDVLKFGKNKIEHLYSELGKYKDRDVAYLDILISPFPERD